MGNALDASIESGGIACLNTGSWKDLMLTISTALPFNRLSRLQLSSILRLPLLPLQFIRRPQFTRPLVALVNAVEMSMIISSLRKFTPQFQIRLLLKLNVLPLLRLPHKQLHKLRLKRKLRRRHRPPHRPLLRPQLKLKLSVQLLLRPLLKHRQSVLPQNVPLPHKPPPRRQLHRLKHSA
jgi:hypothetical protein